jgi:hypothetical protein
MAFSWKFLLPLSIINLFTVTLEVFLLRGDEGTLTVGDLGLMTVINLAVTVVSVFVFGNLIRDRVKFQTRRSEQGIVPGVSTIEVS